MSDGYAKCCEDIERAGGWEAYHKKERERKEREARERKDEAISALIALIKKRVCKTCTACGEQACNDYCEVKMTIEKARRA